MVLKFWWLALILAAVAIIVLWLVSRPRKSERGSVPVAHAGRLTSLPAFVQRKRRYGAMLIAACTVLILTGGFVLTGVARPAQQSSYDREKRTRDVMLCLDASGSMFEANEAILDSYIDMVGRFDGERIGMVVFNSTAVQVFPLTDDYDMVQEYLSDAELGFRTNGMRGTDFYAGTVTREGSSLIGDGLVSCVDSFDHEGEDRSRSIVFATDNDLAGPPLFTVPEAAQIAAEEDIRVHVIGATRYALPDTAQQLRDVASSTEGSFHEVGTGSADAIVSAIARQEAQRTPGKQVTIVHDRPALPIALSALGMLAAFLCLWRLKL